MKYLFFVFLSISLLGGCTNKKEPPVHSSFDKKNNRLKLSSEKPVKVPFNGEPEQVDMTSVISDITVVRLNAPDHILFDLIRDVSYKNGKFYVSDLHDKSLFCLGAVSICPQQPI